MWIGECILCLSGRKLDGHCVHVCVCASLGGMWGVCVGCGWWVGGLVIFPSQKRQKSGWAEKRLCTPRLVKRSKTKWKTQPLPSLLPISQCYKTAHAKHWWELNCVYKWGERVCEADFAALIKEKKNTNATLLLHYLPSKIKANQFSVWINRHLICMWLQTVF